MSTTAKPGTKPPTLADLDALPPGIVGEIIDRARRGRRLEKLVPRDRLALRTQHLDRVATSPTSPRSGAALLAADRFSNSAAAPPGGQTSSVRRAPRSSTCGGRGSPS